MRSITEELIRLYGPNNFDQQTVIDGYNRIWNVHRRHSGAILVGVNVESYIPYWTSYVFGIGTLYQWRGGNEDAIQPVETIWDFYKKTSSRIITDCKGLNWVFDEDFLELAVVSDNGYLDAKAFKILQSDWFCDVDHVLV